MSDPSVQLFEMMMPQYRPRLLSFGVTQGTANIFTITTVADVASSLNNKVLYFSAVDGSASYVDGAYYLWINVSGAGTDPAIAGKTGVEVAISADDSAATVATAVAAALDALDDISSAAVGALVTATSLFAGAVTAAADVNTGFTVATTVPGVDAALGNGKYDGVLTQTALGTYNIAFNLNYSRVPEGAVMVKTDNRIPRITAGTIFSITVEMQNVSGGAAIDGSFGILVLGSDALDAILQG